MSQQKHFFHHSLWDLFCLFSIGGIWPRFIEPRFIFKKYYQVLLNQLHPDLEGLKILHFSDLHFKGEINPSFLTKLSRKIQEEKPSLICFSGDWICEAKIEHSQVLKNFLESLSAPYGCFAVYGNHDYEKYVTLNKEGIADVVYENESFIKRVFRRLFSSSSTPQAIHTNLNLTPHLELHQILKLSPFQILQNETKVIPIKNTFLNICGLGDLWANQCDPKKGFENYNIRFPGLVMSHNPDSIFDLNLLSYPAELILCGHTHGGQVTFPFIKRRISGVRHLEFLRGWVRKKEKNVFISQGVGDVRSFRFLTPPQLQIIILKSL